MTVKMAVANAGRGGGKAVLAVPELPTGEARRRLLLRYAELVASLGGTYRTAGDMNITPADLDVVAERCQWVYGTTGAGGNSGRGTARGVLHGIRASVEHVFGSPDLAGRTVLVQGVGAVGHDLARDLRRRRRDACSSPTSTKRARASRPTSAPTSWPRPTRSTTECDVYSPCAVGGTLSAESIPRLRCRIVAGLGEQPARRARATPSDCAKPESSTRPTT